MLLYNWLETILQMLINAQYVLFIINYLMYVAAVYVVDKLLPKKYLSCITQIIQICILKKMCSAVIN